MLSFVTHKNLAGPFMKAKTIILVAILFFVSPTGSHAQKGFWLDGSAEIKNSRIGDYFLHTDILDSSGNYVPMHTAFTPKISIGAAAGYNINERIGVSIGLTYSMLGHEYYNYMYNYSGFTIEYKRKLSLNYIEVPLQIYYTHSPGKKVSLIAAAGGYAALLVSYKDENKLFLYDGSIGSATAEGKSLTESLTSSTTTININASLKEEPYNAYDYGLIAGIGIRIMLSDKKCLTLMPQYSFGLVNVKNKKAEVVYQNQTYLYWKDRGDYSPNLEKDYINSSIGLKIGLRFAL